MKNENEIKEALDKIMTNDFRLADRGDNFKWGRWVGRNEALEWVLGQVGGKEISINEDYQSWYQDMVDGTGPLSD